MTEVASHQAPEPGRQGAGLKRALGARPVYGLFLVTGSAMLAEATHHTGIDWAVIDMEGAAMTRVDAFHQVQALTAAEVAPVIRVPGLDRNAIEFALDLGSAGVVIPKVDTAEEAALAAALTRYPRTGAAALTPCGQVRITPGHRSTLLPRFHHHADQETRPSGAEHRDPGRGRGSNARRTTSHVARVPVRQVTQKTRFYRKYLEQFVEVILHRI